MNTTKPYRLAGIAMLPLTIVLAAIMFTGARLTVQNVTPFLASLQEKVNKFTEYKPEDRVYLHLDKPFYYPGDDIWFSAYVRDAQEFHPSTKSDILTVELINPKGTVEKSIRLISKDGNASGDFHIDEYAAGGLYTIKAYTQWQQNDEDHLLFEKQLTVQKPVLPRLKMKLEFDRKAFGPGDKVTASLDLQTNENKPLSNKDFKIKTSLGGEEYLVLDFHTDGTGKSKVEFNLPADLSTNDGLLNILIDYEGLTESISRSIPILLNQLDFTFFPEGGDMIAGLPARVAFKALNEFGKPADVEGYIVDQSGKRVADFSSFHQGMGSFSFTPAVSGIYSAKITKPEGIRQEFTLPRPLPRGYSMQVDAKKGQVNLNIHSTETGLVNVVAQVRGKIYWNSGLNLVAGKNYFSIPTDEFPMGVAQVTLFDAKGIARAERLAFVNRDRKMKIDIATNKDKYLPREKVKMSVDVTDESGMPVPAILSMAVVNDQLLSFADDKTGNILSRMLLEYDLKEKVEESAFYFDRKEEKAEAALDYLLMTSGWRRFDWRQIQSGEMPPLTYAGEKAVVSGRIMDNQGKPLQGVKVTDQQTGKFVLTNKEGWYSFQGIEIESYRSFTAELGSYQAQAMYAYNYTTSLNAYMYKPEVYYYNYSAPVKMNKAAGNVPKVGALAGAVNQPAEPDMVVPEMVFGQEQMVVEDAVAARELFDVENEVVDLKKAEAAPLEVMAADPGHGVEKQKDERDHRAGEQNFKAMMEEEIVTGTIVDRRANVAMQGFAMDKKNIGGPSYYRARIFPQVKYDTQSGQPAMETERTDFRSTIFWNPRLEIDRTGHAEVEFYNSDEITSFRTTIEGIGSEGSIGHEEHVHYTQMPFTLNTKVPVEVATEDVVNVPVILKNNTDGMLMGTLEVKSPAALSLLSSLDPQVMLLPGEVKTIFLKYKVNATPGKDFIRVNFNSQGMKDAFAQEIIITPKGFPVNLSFSGNQKVAEFPFDIRNLVNGSLKVNFSAYPSVMTDLLKGIESILREPYGCFEQTSTSSYPNVLVMQYLKDEKDADPSVVKRANDLLDQGYKRLTSYETKDKGYEWFGSSPPHEALTAYGLMQFNDMKGVYGGVSQEMIDRTAKWLMTRRDGKGGFMRDPKALDSFGSASPEITNAYIVYALSEAGYTDLKLETDKAYEAALASKDPYQLALMANALFSQGDKVRGANALSLLLKTQAENGSFTGLKHSITVSSGVSLTVETSSLAALAMMKANPVNEVVLQKTVKYIVSSRSGYGGFGSTQGTILALKSLTRYAQHSKATPEDGTILVYVDGKEVAKREYKAGDKGAIEVKELENCLDAGKHKIKVEYVGVKNPLPYSVNIDYSTTLPASSKECKVTLSTTLNETECGMGETVRLSAKLTNITNEGLPMTMAIIGIPAGLSAQPWQLKEMQEKGVFDFYEVIGSNVVAYYRQMKPNEVRSINLDLKAEVPGSFEAPASSAYLYYTAEHKFWCALPKVTVN